MGITMICHMDFECTPEVTDYLDAVPEAKHRWEQAVIDATKGNIAAGSNNYTTLTEWAEFHQEWRARDAYNRIHNLHIQFNLERINREE